MRVPYVTKSKIKWRMNYFDIIQLILYIVTLVTLTPITGKYMAEVFENKPFKGRKAFQWAEKLIYKALRHRS